MQNDSSETVIKTVVKRIDRKSPEGVYCTFADKEKRLINIDRVNGDDTVDNLLCTHSEVLSIMVQLQALLKP